MIKADPYLMLALNAEVEQISLFSFEVGGNLIDTNNFWGTIDYQTQSPTYTSIERIISDLPLILNSHDSSDLCRIIDFTHKRTFFIHNATMHPTDKHRLIAYYNAIRDGIFTFKMPNL